MKKIVVLLIVLFTVSCSVGSDDYLDISEELLPIESVTLPDQFVLNQIHTIGVTWVRPTTCHALKDIYYQPNDNERTVAVIASVFNSNNNCEEIATEIETTFNFKPTQTGLYIFKFWQGTDANNEDEYLEIEITVFE